MGKLPIEFPAPSKPRWSEVITDFVISCVKSGGETIGIDHIFYWIYLSPWVDIDPNRDYIIDMETPHQIRPDPERDAGLIGDTLLGVVTVPKGEFKMAEKKEIRTVVNHHVSQDCKPEGVTTSQMVSYPKSAKEPIDIPMHKFELVLTVPQLDEDTDAGYGFTLQQVIAKGMEKIGNDVDKKFMTVLFDRINGEETNESGTVKVLWDGIDDVPSISQDEHDNAQKWLNDYIYIAPAKAGKKVEVSSVITMMINSGAITEEEAKGIETAADLERLVQTKLGG